MEQNPANKVKFGQSLLQSTDNIVPLIRSEHQKVSGFYSRSTLDFGRFRDSISSKTFNEQFEIGVQQLKNILNIDI